VSSTRECVRDQTDQDRCSTPGGTVRQGQHLVVLKPQTRSHIVDWETVLASKSMSWKSDLYSVLASNDVSRRQNFIGRGRAVDSTNGFVDYQVRCQMSADSPDMHGKPRGGISLVFDPRSRGSQLGHNLDLALNTTDEHGHSPRHSR
jgi:hypothetical protein